MKRRVYPLVLGWVVYLSMMALPCHDFALAGGADYQIVTGHLPPWSIKGGSGIFPDIIALIEKRLGTQHQPVELPWSRSQIYAKANDNYLIFPLTRTEGREKEYTWIVEVMSNSLAFVSIKGDPVDMESAKQLNKILVHQDSPPFQLLLDKGFANLHTKTMGAGIVFLKMLDKGHGDAWFCPPDLARYSAMGTEFENRLIFGPQVGKNKLYIAGSKKISPVIVSNYRRVFAELVAEGSIDRIMKRYRGEN